MLYDLQIYYSFSDDCDPACLNGGQCVLGVCQCPIEWEGDQCEMPSKCLLPSCLLPSLSLISFHPISDMPSSTVFLHFVIPWKYKNAVYALKYRFDFLRKK